MHKAYCSNTAPTAFCDASTDKIIGFEQLNKFKTGDEQINFFLMNKYFFMILIPLP